MHINKNSWHYKVYNFTYNVYDRPSRTNLCSYLKRVILVAPLHLLMYIIVSLGIVGMLLIVLIPALLVGFRPTGVPFISNSKYEDSYTQYRGWQPKWAPFELYPWHLILLGLIVTIIWSVIHFAGWIYFIIPVSLMLFTAAIVMAYILIYDSESESVRLWKANMAAKKSKICPVVTFDEQDTSSDISE